jgi:hypothetical protein
MSTPPRHRLLLHGQRFGRLLVLEEAPRRAAHRSWRCQCACGAEVIVAQVHLRSGGARSCGCLLRDVTIHRNTVHGGAGTLAYASWQSMRAKCRNPQATNYAHYGGRGIDICPAWEDFAVFVRDMGPRPSRKHRLTRLDDDGDFGPENCRWATESERRQRKGWGRSKADPG